MKTAMVLALSIAGMTMEGVYGQATIPENDSFVTRIALFGTNVTTTGRNTGATFEPGEPDPSFQGGKSVWWTWTAPTDGNLTLTTAGSSFDTMLTVFTGGSVTNLTLVAFNDMESNTSVLTFNVAAGTAYQIAVDGALGAAGDISLQLSLGPPQPPPANDNFANRITISGSHLNNVPGSNLGATAEPGEPFHADAIGLKSVWWTWTAPFSGGVTLTTQGSAIDTVLGVYTGNSLANLVLVAGNDEDPVTFSSYSRVEFNAISNVTYQIAVDGFEGASGFTRLRLDLDNAFPVPANDNFANRITLTGGNITTNGSNIGASFEPDEPLHLVTFGGKSVWWRWTAPSSGGVTLSVSNDLVDTLVAVYRGNSLGTLVFVAGNDEDFLTTLELDSTAYFNATAGTTYQIAVDGVDGASGDFNLHLVLGAADPVPANDNFANRITLTGNNVTTNGFNSGATLEVGEPLHRGYYGGKSVWWRWTAPGPGFVTIDTIGSLADTLLAVYTGTALTDLVEVASDDESGGNYTSLVTFPTKSNVTYQIAVDGYDGDGFDLTLRVRFTPASYSLTTGTNPPGAGTVSINPPPDQAGKYAPGSIVTLTATPGSRSLFTGWTDGVTSTNNPVVLAVTSNKTVVAGFSVIPIVQEWIGGSATTGNWSDSENWSDGPPIGGDELVFPAGASRLTSNTNDFPTNTIFNSITFADAGYILRGNPLRLNDGIFSINASGTNTVSLDVQLNADQSFRCGNAAAALEITGKLNLANRTLTVEGMGETILAGAISGTGGIIKTNAGMLSLMGTNANTYTGPTLVNEGILQLAKDGVAIAGPLTVGDGIGGANADVVRFADNAQLGNAAAVTVRSSGQLDLDGFTGAAASLTMNGGTVATGPGSLSLNGGVTVNSNSAQANITGTLLLQGATRTFNIADGPAAMDLVVSAVVRNGTGTGGILKTGSGTLQLAVSNTYSGTTTINEGTLALGNPFGLGSTNLGTIINSDGLLSLNGVSASREALTLAGGTLASGSGSNSWPGNIALTSNSAVTVATNGVLNLPGIISGTGNLTKSGEGTLIFSGASNNTHSGATRVNQGALLLNKTTAGIAVSGALIVGDGNGGVNADVVRFNANSQLASSSAVTINSSGQLDLNGFTNVVAGLTMTSGNLATGPGSLGLNGNLTVNPASAPATITGNLSLRGATRTFSVADGSAGVDLLIAAAIGNGTGTGGILKTGNGTLELTASNSYSGTTTIDEGVLAIAHAYGLGTTNQGTIANSNAFLSLNGVSVNGEGLTLAGATLASDSGSNFWTGNIQSASDSTIAVASNGVLTLPVVISGAGGLTKSGAGTLVFSGSSPNTYTGATMVNEGTLSLSKGTSNAVPGVLILGDEMGGADADVVRLEASQQIAIGSVVMVFSSGLLDLGHFSNAIASLSGSGHIDLGDVAAMLGVGHDNASSNFRGVISGAGGVTKVGAGTFVLDGDVNTYTGQTFVNEGRLLVNALQPGSAVLVTAPGVLGGMGRVGNLSGSGTVSPGASPGELSCGDVTLSSNMTYRVELDGPSPGSGYDQLKVSGNVALAGPLDATLGFAPGMNDTFTIVDNDGNDPVNGTFDGLPEGSFLSVGSALFQISYVGGSGSNDVVLTHVQLPASTINSIAMINGMAQIQGTGQSGLSYVIEATSALDPPIGWMPIGTNNTDPNGVYQFIDTNSFQFPVRFYRVRTLP